MLVLLVAIVARSTVALTQFELPGHSGYSGGGKIALTAAGSRPMRAVSAYEPVKAAKQRCRVLADYIPRRFMTAKYRLGRPSAQAARWAPPHDLLPPSYQPDLGLRPPC
jgi:hypothetical protein